MNEELTPEGALLMGIQPEDESPEPDQTSLETAPLESDPLPDVEYVHRLWPVRHGAGGAGSGGAGDGHRRRLQLFDAADDGGGL